MRYMSSNKRNAPKIIFRDLGFISNIITLPIIQDINPIEWPFPKMKYNSELMGLLVVSIEIKVAILGQFRALNPNTEIPMNNKFETLYLKYFRIMVKARISVIIVTTIDKVPFTISITSKLFTLFFLK